jgi:hypothetical protein
MACQGEVLKSIRFSERRLVEAAGVEPLSLLINSNKINRFSEEWQKSGKKRLND